jgi:hypothetical protein
MSTFNPFMLNLLTHPQTVPALSTNIGTQNNMNLFTPFQQHQHQQQYQYQLQLQQLQIYQAQALLLQQQQQQESC